METALFFYNILIMIAFTFCCVNFLLLYHKHRDKSQLYIAAVFFLFIFDNLLLYMFEFLPSFTRGYAFYTLDFTYATIILCYFIILTYRLTILALEKRSVSSTELVLWALYLIAVFALATLSEKLWINVALHMALSFMSVGVFAVALYRHRKIGGFPKRDFVPDISPAFLLAGFLLELTNATERVLSYYDIYLLSSHRRLSIELLSVLFAGAAIWFLLKTQLRPEKTAVAAEPERLDEKQVLSRFSDAFGLTQREKEILELLVQGRSNAEICAVACISEGTVKTHTHNIYAKLDVKNRIQLGIKLSQFQKNGLLK